MCRNPFGNFERLDRIDLFDYAAGSDVPFKLLFLKVIQQAAQDYLFFGLGKNWITLEDFADAHRYFFIVRSERPETWEHARYFREVFENEQTKKRTLRVLKLTDAELKLATFDVHYSLAGLDKVMPREQFTKLLEDQRLTILASTWDQVKEHLGVIDEYAALKSLVAPTEMRSAA